MTAMEMINAEIARLDAILSRRGIWYEDEQVRRESMALAKSWIIEEREEAKRAKAEAEAEKARIEEERRLNDPNRKTKEMFAGVKIRIPEKEWKR